MISGLRSDDGEGIASHGSRRVGGWTLGALAAALAAGGLFAATHSPVDYALSETVVSPNAAEIAGGLPLEVGSGTGLFGGAMTEVGDIDGDGTPDLLVGAAGEIAGEAADAGRAYLLSGADGRVLRSFRSPEPQQYGSFGGAVAGPGDLNGDGSPDVVIGASGEFADDTDRAGRVYLFNGADGKLFLTLTSPNVVETGAFGAAVAEVGDVDGDGTGDVIVGAPQETVDGAEGAGRAYLYSGADGRLLRSLVTPNPEGRGYFGQAVAGIADVNGDGTPDVVVGAHEETVAGTEGAGRAYLVSGADGRVLRTFRSPNLEEGGVFGESVAGVGDVDGDGTSEIAVGAPSESTGPSSAEGRVYLFDAESGDLIRPVESTGAEGAHFGRQLAGVGDVNEDGSADLIVGAPSEPVSDTIFSAGRAYLFDGADGSVLQVFRTPNPSVGGSFGNTVIRGGDLDGDGRGDLVVGAREEMVDSLRAGRVYIYESGEGGGE